MLVEDREPVLWARDDGLGVRKWVVGELIFLHSPGIV
jgi:uncharacterized protein YaeQ